MSDWQQKRFWKETATQAVEGGFTVALDGRAIKTPAKAGLIVPTKSMAQKIAQEWDAQEELVRPAEMPFTRTANAAIDKVATQRAEVADMLAEYGDSDLLCYRAASPAELRQRQNEAWDPVLDWATHELNATLVPHEGVMHVAQEAAALAALSGRVHQMDPFQLAAFHDLVSLPGSLVLGFAAALDWAPVDEIWRLARIDETWQEEQWGEDEEATAHAQLKQAAFQHAKAFFDLC